MASIQSLLEPTTESYVYRSEELPKSSRSPFSNPEDFYAERAEKESAYADIDLKSFQRAKKKTHAGFGTRTFPPKIDCNKHELFHFKRSSAPGRVKQKHAALAALVAFPKPYKFSRDQKMRGFVVDKDFKARAWNQDEIRIPTLGGKVLRLPGYAACNLPLYHVTNTLAPPLKRQFPHDPPCREIPGFDPRYLVSTITKPIVRPGPAAPAPMPIAPMKAPISNHLLPVTPSKSSKERMSCTVPNCGKDFADRSSLNRHKKRMHPELTNSRSNLSRA